MYYFSRAVGEAAAGRKSSAERRCTAVPQAADVIFLPPLVYVSIRRGKVPHSKISYCRKLLCKTVILGLLVDMWSVSVLEHKFSKQFKNLNVKFSKINRKIMKERYPQRPTSKKLSWLCMCIQISAKVIFLGCVICLLRAKASHAT